MHSHMMERIDRGATLIHPKTTREVRVGEFMDSVQVTPHFQPVIDLFSAAVTGFEVLSRGVPPYATPGQMFSEAKRLGATWDLERTCRIAALKKIASVIRPCFRKSPHP